MTQRQNRPTLGKLEPGQEVVVRLPFAASRGRDWHARHVPARVAIANRVWIDLVSADGRLKWRMRRDSQDEGSSYSQTNASFATLEQHEWDAAQHHACALIKKHGITLAYDSPWRGREIELADLLVRSTVEAELLVRSIAKSGEAT